jgi:hypothetical protein
MANFVVQPGPLALCSHRSCLTKPKTSISIIISGDIQLCHLHLSMLFYAADHTQSYMQGTSGSVYMPASADYSVVR